MTLNKIPKDNLYIKMKYITSSERFKIFVNETKIHENIVEKYVPMFEKTQIFKVPVSILDKNKISVKSDWPLNNVNRVFGLCIREFLLTEKE